MAIPFFYIPTTGEAQTFITLDEDTSKHVVQVLRMKIGEQLLLTDGKGNLLTCKITGTDKKKCVVAIQETKYKKQETRKICVAISLLKNVNRFEWFLEKATELGITEIVPLICERTEKLHFRYDRMQNIVVSAMLQSQQSWLPELKQPITVNEIIRQSHQSQKFIAHCIDDAKIALSDAINSAMDSQIILIGPEGDFTKEEVEFALHYHFVSVTLGETRLRTETAGIVAATLLTRQ
jgi:16S rRNA (uracil1498-N3)-methyltransferase